MHNRASGHSTWSQSTLASIETVTVALTGGKAAFVLRVRVGMHDRSTGISCKTRLPTADLAQGLSLLPAMPNWSVANRTLRGT
jgi:hypothetical protein